MTEIQTRETSTAVEHHATAYQALNREQIELVKNTVAQGTTDDELALFLETARRRGLDPFSGQIHAIMRWDGRAGREVMKIQTGIDGYRSIANRTGLIDYVEGPEWTSDGETWVDVWLQDVPPAAARFTVKRKDRSRPETRVATWMEYRQTNRQGELTRAWAELGPTMIGKVAEAAALRAAFPDELGGLYTAEEMDQASTPPAADGDAPQPTAADPQAEERDELARRFGAAWRSLDPEVRNGMWSSTIAKRLRGNVGDLRDAFAATPVHVLVEIVEAVEAEADDGDGDEGETPADPDGPDPDGGDDAQDGPDDDAPVDVCDGCGTPEGDDHEDGCPVAAKERELAEELNRGTRADAEPSDPFEGLSTTEAAATMEQAATDARAGREPETQAAKLARLYPTMSVVEVSSLIRQGHATLSSNHERPSEERVEIDGLTAPERSNDRTEALLYVELLEAEHHGTDGRPAGRKTIAGALSSAGLTPQTRKAWDEANTARIEEARENAAGSPETVPAGDDTAETPNVAETDTGARDGAVERDPLPEENTQANRRALQARYEAAVAELTTDPDRTAAEELRRRAGPWTAANYPDLVKLVREVERMVDEDVPF